MRRMFLSSLFLELPSLIHYEYSTATPVDEQTLLEWLSMPVSSRMYRRKFLHAYGRRIGTDVPLCSGYMRED